MNENALIVFVKKPEPGKVKTRLGKTIGFKKAAEVYEQLLQYTATICEQLSGVSVFIYHAEKVNSTDYYVQFSNRVQAQGDLGLKMKDAFHQLFSAEFDKVVCIGSDCISLTPEIIQQSFSALDKNDYVFGPAEDGGYYLIGMKKATPQLFENIAWSTSTVLEDTIAKLKAGNYSLLESLSDIDYEKDLIQHKEDLLAFNPRFFSFLNQKKT